MNDMALDLPVVTATRRLWRRVVWTVALAGAALLIGWIGQWAAGREAQSQTAVVHAGIEINTLGLRGVIAKYSYLPFTVAQHPEMIQRLSETADALREGRVDRYLEEVNRQAGSEALYLMDRQGTTLAASNWNEPSGGFKGESYANRPYFIEALAGRSGLFYGVGKTTGVPGLFISAPVRRDGAVIGVVAVKVSLREIEAAWTHARDPIALTDERGIIFLSSVPAWMYHSTRPLSGADLEWIRSHQQYGDRTTFPAVGWHVEPTEAEGGQLLGAEIGGRRQRFIAANAALPELGWTLTVMADHGVVTRTRELAWAIGALTTAMLLLGGLAWQLRERRLDEQRHARLVLEQRVRERTSELQEAHAFRKAMEDSLLVGMRARDLQGRLIYVNPALCAMVGYRADELVGSVPPYAYWHPDELDKHWRDSNAALSGQAAVTGFESRIRHRDGHDVHTMVYTAPLIDASGRHSGWMSSVVDITAQKAAEKRQHLQDGQLQRAIRAARFAEIASTLAHELNQPLMALATFAGAAQSFSAQGKPDLLAECLGDIKTQTQRCANIVQRIRGFFGQRTEGHAVCAMNAIVGSVLALLKPEIERRRAAVTTRLEPDLPQVHGDRVLLEQVLLNLVLNGLQAMQDTPLGSRLIEIETTRAHGGVRVRVCDQGPGIAAEVSAKIFEPFFTTKDEGLGLGLNFCRTIVESHRGCLDFESATSGGAAFTILLPCTT